jgi:hypothetical protein
MPMQRDGSAGTWTAFLAMAFVVVGLAGIFASYAAPAPLVRAVEREEALDAAAAAAGRPDAAAAIAALRSRLGESADALLPVGGDMAARIAAERRAMRARLLAQAQATAVRARWIIAVVTVMAIGFGAAVLHAARR